MLVGNVQFRMVVLLLRDPGYGIHESQRAMIIGKGERLANGPLLQRPSGEIVQQRLHLGAGKMRRSPGEGAALAAGKGFHAAFHPALAA